jgi:Predicted lipase
LYIRNDNNNVEYSSKRRAGSHRFLTAGLQPTEASDIVSSNHANGNSHNRIQSMRDSQHISNETLNSSEILEESTNLSPYAAPTLDGRLLCSSQCAYEISSPYFRGASYRPGTVAKRITRGVNSALIGHTTDGITIAFRGTQTTSLLDWLQNAALFLSDVDEEKYKIQGKIHTGFYRGTKSIWKPLRGIIKEMIQEAEDNGWSKNIYLTGHSKGGAMASIAAILLKRDANLPDPTHVW